MALADYLPAHQESRVAREIARAARRYLHRFRGFSYDFKEGGEENVLRRLARFPVRTVFDCGANLGHWSSLAQGFFPQAAFHTFEPSLENFERLKARLSGANFLHQNIALGNESGTAEFKDYGPGSPLNTTLLQSDIHDSQVKAKIMRIPLKTGDAYCQDHRISQIDFLKIDVEGAEHLVLQGFEQMLRNSAISIIQFEYGYANGDAHFLMKDFFRFFSSFGYLVAKVRKSSLRFEPFRYEMNDFHSGPNYLAVAENRPDIMKALVQ
jgi:FkbM family methyltransferase